MRHHLKLTTLLIACALSLSACAQSASVGIPTPERVVQNQTTPIPTRSPVELVPTVQPPQPSPTPAIVATPQPAPVATEPAPVPTETELPPTEPAPTDAPNTSSDNVVCNQMVTYVVRSGDNLFRIGLRYKTTAGAIARRNGIADVRVVRTGTQLRILTCG